MKQLKNSLRNAKESLGIPQESEPEDENRENDAQSSLTSAEALNSMTAEVLTDIGTIQSGIAALNQTVSDQKEMLSANEAAIQSLNHEVELQTEKITAADTALKEKEGKIGELETKISEYEGQLTVMRTTVEEWLTPSESSENNE